MVTTNILGDVVSRLVGDHADVATVMAVGAAPHEFQASAQQVAAMREADALVVNGAGFEEGLGRVIDGAEADGVPVFAAISAVPTLSVGGGQVDPHFFTDPARMAIAAQAVTDFLARTVPALDNEQFRSGAQAEIGALRALDRELAQRLTDVPAERRVLVTNHEVFGYFADRYDFEVVGTVIPGGSTSDGASAADLARLAAVIRAKGVPAVFADTSAPDELARTLADEVGGSVAVVALFSESLGAPGSGGASYAEMLRTDAARIIEALM